MPSKLSTTPRLRSALGERRRNVSPVVLLGLLMIAVQILVRLWALSGSWFYFDDLAFISRALNQPMDSHYLFESYGGHLMPAGFALIWVLTKVAVYQWWTWAAVLVVLQLLAGVGMLRLLRSMFGETRVVLALLALYLAYVFTLSAGIWFAAGINQLPMQIALVFGLHSLLAYLRTRRVRHLVSVILWTAAGLVFYEKTLLLIGVYGIVALCWFAQGTFGERLRHLWTTYRAGFVALAVLGIGYGVLYAEVGLNFSPGNAGNRAVLPLAANLIAVSGLTGVVGGPLHWQPLDVGAFADPSQLVRLIAWLGVGAIGYYAYKTRTKSLRAWLPLGFTMLANILLLTSARANVVGPDIGREYRYQTETAALFVIGLGLAFLPLQGAPEVNAPREGVDRRFETPGPVMLLTSAVVLAALMSTISYVNLWQDQNDTASYYATVKKTLADAPDRPVPLVDSAIPQHYLWAYRTPENNYSHVFRNLASQTAYPTQATDQIYMFDDKGRLSYADVPALRSMLPGVGCGYPLRKSSTDVTLNGGILGTGWWARVSTYAKEPTTVTVTAGDEVHHLEIPAGLHNSFLTASGRFITVEFSDYQSSAHACVTGLVIGVPKAVAVVPEPSR